METQENTMTIAAPMVVVSTKMSPLSDGAKSTVETVLESYDEVKDFLSTKPLRRPFRPDHPDGRTA